MKLTFHEMWYSSVQSANKKYIKAPPPPPTKRCYFVSAYLNQLKMVRVSKLTFSPFLKQAAQVFKTCRTSSKKQRGSLVKFCQHLSSWTQRQWRWLGKICISQTPFPLLRSTCWSKRGAPTRTMMRRSCRPCWQGCWTKEKLLTEL